MEEYCHCGYEVEYDCDWSDFAPSRNYVACSFCHDEKLGVPNLGGLIKRAPDGRKSLLLSSINRKRSLKPSYLTCEGK